MKEITILCLVLTLLGVGQSKPLHNDTNSSPSFNEAKDYQRRRADIPWALPEMIQPLMENNSSHHAFFRVDSNGRQEYLPVSTYFL